MTQIDGLSLPVRVHIAGDAFDLASHYARQHGLSISDAASEMLRNFAHAVESGPAPCTPAAGRGDSGEPPAPLSPGLWNGRSVKSVKPADPFGHTLCTFVGCRAHAEVKITLADQPAWLGQAACAEHRPDAPVLTLEQSKALHPSSKPPVVYVEACPTCGERSKHGRCS